MNTENIKENTENIKEKEMKEEKVTMNEEMKEEIEKKERVSVVPKIFLGSLYIEHSQLNPDGSISNLRDTLTVDPIFDKVNILLKTIQYYSDTRCIKDFWESNPEDVKKSFSFDLNIEEVKMLVTKLNEFLKTYEEYGGRNNYVVGKHENPFKTYENHEDFNL